MKTFEEIYLKQCEKIIKDQLKKIWRISNSKNGYITSDFHILCEDLKHLVREYKHNRYFVDLMLLDDPAYDREKYFRVLCYAYGFIQEDI